MLTPTEMHRACVPIYARQIPQISGITRSGGRISCAANPKWVAGLLATEKPDITASARRRWYLAHGVDLAAGHVSSVRRVIVTRPRGFPAWIISPDHGWSRAGSLAKPAGRLP